MMVLFLRIMSTLWYVLFFGLILPFTMVLVSLSLDVQLVERFGIQLSLSPLLIGTAAVLGVASLSLMLLSVVVLHHEGKGYPWSFGSHVAYNPQKLVTSGPFAVVRNPMATSYLLFLWAIGCLVPSLVMVIWMVPLAAGLLYEYLEFTEEKRLVDWFGKEYLDYQKRTPSLLPRVDVLWKNLGKTV
jgi:protein-S-isoprenylcysteine O-methyltransferase Ste14